jgi:anti-sigma B factor antagonist
MSSVRLVRGVPVAAAPDRLDGETSRRLELELSQLAEHGYATIVVDLSNTRFCDQAGLAVVICAHERASAEGGELRLAGTGRVVRRMSSPGGVPSRPCRFASVDEAVAELPAPAIAPPAARFGSIWLVRDNRRQRIRRTGRGARPMKAVRA